MTDIVQEYSTVDSTTYSTGNLSSNLVELGTIANEEYHIKSRKSFKSEIELSKVTFEFTRDPAYIHQLYGAGGLYERESQFLISNLNDFQEAEVPIVEDSQILVARIGNFVVGGARLTVSSPRKPKILPIEVEGFKISDHFPDLVTKQMTYGELSGLVVLEEFRSGDFTRKIFSHFYRKAVAVGMQVGFAAAPWINVRAYQRNFAALGFNDHKIHKEILLPSLPGFAGADDYKDYLISMNLK